MRRRNKAITMSILLLLNQPSQAAFNLIDDPERESTSKEELTYKPLPKYPENPYRQAGYTPAVYKPLYKQQTDQDSVLPLSIPSSGVVETGIPDMAVQVVRKSGKRKPLPDALRAILPKGWHAKKKADVDRSLPISWDRGWDWVTTLNDVAKENRLSILVDWDTQTVIVLKQDRTDSVENDSHNVYTVSEEKYQKMVKRNMSESKSKNTSDSLPEIHIAEPDKAIALPLPIKPVAAVNYVPSLHLIGGQKMSESLDKWAKSIGWNLIWDAKVDYPVSVNTTFTGNTEEIITKFGDAVVHSHLPLHIDVYKQNKTVRISN